MSLAIHNLVRASQDHESLVCQGVGEDETSQDGMQAQDRKALRKAKNRASAAASRARREAYTASLEDEVTISSCSTMSKLHASATFTQREDNIVPVCR